MSSNKPLIVDKRDKVNGLYTYCQKCKMLTENRKCGETGKKITSCKNTDKHVFKAIISVPGTSGKKRKTKQFKTRDLKKAIELKLEFEKDLENNSYQSSEIQINEVESRPDLLIECMAMYIGYLNNEGVAAHKIKVRTDKHIKETERYFLLFSKCLKEHGIDPTFLKIGEINDKIVSAFHSYMLNEKNYANKTYNKIIALFRQFINWLIDRKGYSINNPFTEVVRRPEIMDRTTITMDEFKVLLKTICPEKGYKTLKSGERKNQYREWLPEAFQLALETGLRREEFMNIKFSNIEHDDSGKPLFIVVQNFKVNRSQGTDESTGRLKYVPITKGLKKLLDNLGYEFLKDSDQFIIGREETSSRRTLIDVVSKAFTHFWKLTGIEKNVQLKHLRKTYLTSLVAHFGDKATVISDHSSVDVLKKHYINDKQLIAAANDFQVFQK